MIEDSLVTEFKNLFPEFKDFKLKFVNYTGYEVKIESIQDGYKILGITRHYDFVTEDDCEISIKKYFPL